MGAGRAHSLALIPREELQGLHAFPAAEAFWMNSHTFLLLNGCMRCRMPAGQLGPSWCILLRPAVIRGSRPVKASTSFFQRAARPWALAGGIFPECGFHVTEEVRPFPGPAFLIFRRPELFALFDLRLRLLTVIFF
jgi:hypothetical protein